MAAADQVEAVVISDIYDRDVSDVVIVCPYTGANAITDELGADWSGADRLADQLDSHDSDQAVIAVHQGEVVESEVVPIDVLDLCDMGLRSPATVDAGTTLQISHTSMAWSDGTTKTVPVASLG